MERVFARNREGATDARLIPAFGGFCQGSGQVHRIVPRQQEVKRTRSRVLDSENGMGHAINRVDGSGPAR
jgi:hypothetical protein